MAEDVLTGFKIVAIGGSAGSLEVILPLLKSLPSPLPAALIVVVHRKNDQDSILETLFAYQTNLPVQEVDDKDPILPGYIYIAPPDYHLLIEDAHHFSLDSSEKVYYSRPSIDVTFESVAEVFTKRVIGMLLSGANSDGAKGLLKIKAMGGHTLAQDPEDAEIGFMPQQAIELGAVDEVVNTAGLIRAIRRLLGIAEDEPMAR